MKIQWPQSPNNGQRYTSSSGKAWVFNGEGWESSNDVNVISESISTVTTSVTNLTSSINEGVTYLQTQINTINTQLSNISVNVNWGNIYFVDVYHGSATGTVSDLTKPWSNANTAVAAAYATSPTVLEPALVWLRAGQYNVAITLRPNVIVYCEPGVVFWTGGFTTDATTVKATVMGHAIFRGYSYVFSNSYGCEVDIEFNSIDKQNSGGYGRALSSVVPASNGTAYIRLSCNKIFMQSTAYDITIRGNTNMTLNVKSEIVTPYSLVALTSSDNGDAGTPYTGKCIINAPIIRILAGGPLGETNKNVTRCFYMSSTSECIINGDVYVESASTSGEVCAWLKNQQGSKVIFNGSVYSGNSIAVNDTIWNWNNGMCVFNKSVIGNNRLVNVFWDSKVYFNNCSIKKKNIISTQGMYIRGNALLSLYNCQYLQEDSTLDMIYIDSSSVNLNMLNTYNVLNGATGSATFINTLGYTPSLGIKNSVSNIDVSNNSLHRYNSGLYVEPSLTLPALAIY